MKKSGFVIIERELLLSPAWVSLGGISAKVYLIFRGKCQFAKRRRGCGKHTERLKDRILNNGQLVFTYAEAQKIYGMTAPRFTRTIDELIEKGLIDITATGAGVHKVVTLYAISERWQDYGTPSFKEAHRPERRIKCGFRKGNKLWQKKNSTDTFVHSIVNSNVHSPVFAMHTNVHGRKVVNQYIPFKNKELYAQTA